MGIKSVVGDCFEVVGAGQKADELGIGARVVLHYTVEFGLNAPMRLEHPALALKNHGLRDVEARQIASPSCIVRKADREYFVSPVQHLAGKRDEPVGLGLHNVRPSFLISCISGVSVS
jgi:hypothetical protein